MDKNPTSFFNFGGKSKKKNDIFRNLRISVFQNIICVEKNKVTDKERNRRTFVVNRKPSHILAGGINMSS